MRQCIIITVSIFLLLVTQGYSAPVLFNNVMTFDNHNFGLIDFETYTIYSEIDTYLQPFDAQLVGGDFGGAVVYDSSNYVYGEAISPTQFLGGTKGAITIHFNSPVQAFGFFLSAMYYVSRTDFEVITADPLNTTYHFNYSDVLSSKIGTGFVNGFLGVMDTQYGISEVSWIWGIGNVERSGIDNIYFGNNITTGLGDGPTLIDQDDISTIALPTFNGMESFNVDAIPEPASILLLGCTFIVFLRKKVFD